MPLLFFRQYADQSDFLWRLARAHSDMCEITDDADEKRSYACDGRELRAQGEGSGAVKAGVTLQSYQPRFFPPLLQLVLGGEGAVGQALGRRL